MFTVTGPSGDRALAAPLRGAEVEEVHDPSRANDPRLTPAPRRTSPTDRAKG